MVVDSECWWNLSTKNHYWLYCYFMDEFIAGYLIKTIAYIQRRQWHPTPVLLPGKSHGRRSLVGCGPWGRTESDTTERLHFHFSLSRIGEGNGNPVQCSCLENPGDRGAWWAAVCGVVQSRTRLKRLSSSSSWGGVPLTASVPLITSHDTDLPELSCLFQVHLGLSGALRQSAQHSHCSPGSTHTSSTFNVDTAFSHAL